MNDLSPEEYLLILAARLYLDDETADMMKKILRQSPDWNLLLRDAKRLGMLPLLYKHLSEMVQKERDEQQNNITSDIPDEVMRHLKQNFRQQAMHRFLLHQQLNRLLESLRQYDIPVIPLKGAFLANTIYKDITLRPMSDIDILIREQDMQQVQECMVGMGYHQKDEEKEDEPHENQPAYYHSPLHESLFARKPSHLTPFYKPGEISRVEVHLHIFPGIDYNAELMEQIWKSDHKAHLCTPDYKAALCEPMSLAPEDLLIHLTLHLNENFKDKCGNVDLCWICDIHEVIRHYEKQIDWQLFCRKADAAGGSPHIGEVLCLLKENWHTPVPDSVLRHLARGTEPLFLTYIFHKKAETDETHYSHYAIRIRTLRRINGWKNRLIFLLRFVFPTREYLMARYDLKNIAETERYYIIHPCKLLWRAVQRIGNDFLIKNGM